MVLAYVSYEQAKKLKEVGFDEYCGSSYIKGELCKGIGWKSSWKFTPERGFSNDSAKHEMIPAPMYVEVWEWLRRKGAKCWLSRCSDDLDVWEFTVGFKHGDLQLVRISDRKYSDAEYDIAQSDLLDHILEAMVMDQEMNSYLP